MPTLNGLLYRSPYCRPARSVRSRGWRCRILGATASVDLDAILKALAVAASPVTTSTGGGPTARLVDIPEPALHYHPIVEVLEARSAVATREVSASCVAVWPWRGTLWSGQWGLDATARHDGAWSHLPRCYRRETCEGGLAGALYKNTPVHGPRKAFAQDTSGLVKHGFVTSTMR